MPSSWPTRCIPAMATEYTVFRTDGTSPHQDEVEWPDDPGLDLIHALVDPLLGDGEPLEHVTVLYRGERCDMFVSELGHVALTHRPPLPINDRATAIYRRAWLTAYPGSDPDTLPTIAGVAVLFHRQVWF